jgi:hypothetical protein
LRAGQKSTVAKEAAEFPKGKRGTHSGVNSHWLLKPA